MPVLADGNTLRAVDRERRGLGQTRDAFQSRWHVGRHPPVENLLEHREVRLFRKLGADDHLPRLARGDEPAGVVVVEQRAEARVVAEAPDGAAVGNDPGKASSHPVRGIQPKRLERRDDDIGIRRRLRRRARSGKRLVKLRRVVQATG